jgi:hypothetical protein
MFVMVDEFLDIQLDGEGGVVRTEETKYCGVEAYFGGWNTKYIITSTCYSVALHRKRVSISSHK